MSKATVTGKGKAFAARVDGNVYQVTYERSVSMDRDVGYRYLQALVESGYEVVIAASQFGGRETGTLVGGEVVWAKA